MALEYFHAALLAKQNISTQKEVSLRSTIFVVGTSSPTRSNLGFLRKNRWSRVLLYLNDEHAQIVVTLDNARVILDRLHHTSELHDATESRSLHSGRDRYSKIPGIGNPPAKWLN